MAVLTIDDLAVWLHGCAEILRTGWFSGVEEIGIFPGRQMGPV